MLKQTQRLLLSGAAALALSAGTAWAGPPSPSVWTGFYFGANAGVGMGADSATFANVVWGTFPNPNVDNFGGSGGLAGVQAGFNKEFANGFVLGFEADADVASINSDRYFGGKGGYGGSLPFFGGKGDQHVSSHYSWLTTARVRAGVPVGNFLLFGTGGVAVAGIENGYSSTAFGGHSISQSGARVGWALGAGGQIMVTPTMSLTVQFLHEDFGSQTLSIPTSFDLGPGGQTITFNNSLNILTAGVSWKLP